MELDLAEVGATSRVVKLSIIIIIIFKLFETGFT